MNELNWKKIKFLRFRIGVWAATAFSITGLAYEVFIAFGRNPSINKLLFGLIACLAAVVFSLIPFVYEARAQIRTIKARQNWLINVMNWNSENLDNHNHNDNYEALEPEDNTENIEAVKVPSLLKEDAKVSEKPPHWPWGNHHTDTLGHLEAAARRFWKLYDPGDISTAPTNDMVATWLQEERGISKEKARAIASMLRPDGLPTGPRR